MCASSHIYVAWQLAATLDVRDKLARYILVFAGLKPCGTPRPDIIL